MKAYTYNDFLRIMDTLLGENGCPWDLEQTHESLKPYLLEECYEVIDAIERKDMNALCEELGDVLQEVVFQAKLAEKEAVFTMEQVVDGIAKKMVLRHPHIFSGVKADTTAEVLDNWEKIKKEEKGYTTNIQVLKSVPKVLPALLRAYKLQKKASKAGLFEGDVTEAIDSAISGLETLKDKIIAGDREQNEQIEKLLFEIVNISRFLEINPEFALTNAIEQFINRFECQEKTKEFQTIFKEEYSNEQI